MQITIPLPDYSAASIVDGVCRATGWTADSGVAKGVWAKNKVIEDIRAMAKRGMVLNSSDGIKSSVDGVAIT